MKWVRCPRCVNLRLNSCIVCSGLGILCPPSRCMVPESMEAPMLIGGYCDLNFDYTTYRGLEKFTADWVAAIYTQQQDQPGD